MKPFLTEGIHRVIVVTGHYLRRLKKSWKGWRLTSVTIHTTKRVCPPR